ncbi:MAG: ribonuclease P protein component [Pseudomonadota bacterium]
MKGKVILLDSLKDGASAAALVVNGRLEDLIIDPKPGTGRPMAGDTCVVKVTRKLQKSGAFCQMAGGEGYLRDARNVKEGALMLAQVLSLPESGKAPTLTTRILHKGPRIILTPGAPGVNVSKKIGNAAERDRLKAAVEEIFAQNSAEVGRAEPDKDMGAIIRTEARGADQTLLSREVAILLVQHEEAIAILNVKREIVTRPTGASEAIALRDWLLPMPDAIVASPACAARLTRDPDPHGPSPFFGDDRFPPLVEPDPSPFETHGVWSEFEALNSPVFALGDRSMVIEPTRALVAVDVNTGADFSPAAGLKTNLAVARELPRQLRLRGLGGKIAIDFAPMPKQNRRSVEDALKKAFRGDPIETVLVGWTSLGLFELQRKRERWPLATISA